LRLRSGVFLAGVADVTDRSKLRGELARLGHPVAEVRFEDNGLLSYVARGEVGVLPPQ